MLRPPSKKRIPQSTLVLPPLLKPINVSIQPSDNERRNNESKDEKYDDEAGE
jgi:hypothetical protein